VTYIPPEDLIDKNLRQEILQVYQQAFEESTSLNDMDDMVHNSSDELSLYNAKKALKKFQLEDIKTKEIRTFFEFVDDGGNLINSLDADMFLRFAAAKILQREKSDKAFALMDGGQKGVIVIEDLQRVAAELGEEFTEDDLQEMMDFVDWSGEGLLTPNHFFQIARQVNL
jgi:Ca2+-binding EF-hand superfamily protein